MLAPLPFDPVAVGRATPDAPLPFLTSACLTGPKTGWLGADGEWYRGDFGPTP